MPHDAPRESNPGEDRLRSRANQQWLGLLITTGVPAWKAPPARSCLLMEARVIRRGHGRPPSRDCPGVHARRPVNTGSER